MPDAQRTVKVSKYLSKHLRHQPERLGLVLEPGGWVPVDVLLQACAARAFPVSREELEQVVAASDKQRFAFSADGTRIRANQGHSVQVDLGLAPVTPPDVLYHGTGAKSVDSILASGLERRSRHHVHLSPDVETAVRVGRRHGKPVVFAVDAARMAADGLRFYVSENGVWLADAVPPHYLSTI